MVSNFTTAFRLRTIVLAITVHVAKPVLQAGALTVTASRCPRTRAERSSGHVRPLGTANLTVTDSGDAPPLSTVLAGNADTSAPAA